MNCPECGSELLLSAEKGINKCTKCLMKEYNSIKQQQRLERVLSKFDKNNKDYYTYNCNPTYEFNHTLIYYDVRGKYFYLPNVSKLSLKTVESILEDLEKGQQNEHNRSKNV